MRKTRVASVQMEHYPGDKQRNLKTIESFVQAAHKKDVEIILFPECCITGYWHLRNLSKSELLEVSEPVFDGPSSQAMLEMSRDCNMTIAAGLIERSDESTLYNTHIVSMPNGHLIKHRKLHAFISKHIASGSSFSVFDTPQECRVGLLTCYDNNIGENVRITALKGADILLAPHQTGGCNTGDVHCMGTIPVETWHKRHEQPQMVESEFRGPKGREWLLRWLPTRAHDNGLFLIFSNGVGIDDDEVRPGGAMILNPYGKIIQETWKARDDMVIADLDPELRKRNQGQRWLRARRPELYTPLITPTGIEQDTRTVRFAHLYSKIPDNRTP